MASQRHIILLMDMVTILLIPTLMFNGVSNTTAFSTASSERIHRTPTTFISRLNPITHVSLTLSSTSNDNDSTDQSQQQLTDQDRILREALGIEPESQSQRELRLQQRQSTIDASDKNKRVNVFVAMFAFTVAMLNYGYQFTHPLTSIALLSEMQGNSADISLIGKNGKPTVVDFWAPWCENCKVAAPTLYAVEQEYGSQVNFVMVNGDLGENYPLIERFGVDAIPHLAMVESDGTIDTALIGPIPRWVLRDDIDALLENSNKSSDDMETQNEGKVELPHTMYDAFRGRPELRKVSF